MNLMAQAIVIIFHCAVHDAHEITAYQECLVHLISLSCWYTVTKVGTCISSLLHPNLLHAITYWYQLALHLGSLQSVKSEDCKLGIKNYGIIAEPARYIGDWIKEKHLFFYMLLNLSYPQQFLSVSMMSHVGVMAYIQKLLCGILMFALSSLVSEVFMTSCNHRALHRVIKLQVYHKLS